MGRSATLSIVCFLAVFAAAAGAGAENRAASGHRVIAPPGSELGLPFSPGILSDDFLFLSGAIGNHPGTTTVEGDAAAQTRQTLENLRTVLAAADMDFSRVVDASVFLSDIRHFLAMADVYAEVLGDSLPARTTVEADIAIPEAVTEISMIAARPGVEIRAISPEFWPANAGRYSWGVLAGDTLFIAGMVANDPAAGAPASGGPAAGGAKAQVRKAMENVGAVLAAVGMGFDNVVSCGVFLPDARDFGAMNEVYPTFYETAAPARATVRAGLVDPAWRVEIQCRAVRGERRAVLPPGATAIPRLSPAIQVGDTLFLSGMVGRVPDGFPPGVAAQPRITLDRLAATLKAAGMGFRDVVNASVFLADVRHYSTMNAIYREVVGAPPPARAIVGTQLMSPDALVEIQMTAVAAPAP